MSQSVRKKLDEIHKAINYFVKSIRERPFVSELDKARVLGFIRSLRDIIGNKTTNPPTKYKVYEPEDKLEVDIDKQTEAIRNIRKKLRRHDNDD